ncbi:MAG: subclass B3 metallo-beta-lactamase [Luteitalea sp.]|nr:subclass B3 metallo-beta-lactamase [Luteitalea sp.]
MLHSLFLMVLTMLLPAQQESWKAPFPAHKIAGNLHYVGTEDLACFLITTPEGHILINTGLADSAEMIRESVEKLGHKLEDIEILLIMQAHFDHVAALAEIQKLTRARLFATEADAPALEDGGRSDPFLPEEYRFTRVKVDRRLRDGDIVRLGGTELEVHLTPGHSKGSVSYSMSVVENGKTYSVAIANMGSVVMPLVDNEYYPRIVEDFAQSFRVQKTLAPDIWVAAHGSQCGMREKYEAGSFVDPEGYKQAIDRFENLYLEQLARERRQ